MNEWTLMELGGYLERKTLPGGFTFTKTIPRNTEYGTPEMVVGLGWFIPGGIGKASYLPNSQKWQFANPILDSLNEVYLYMHQQKPDTWQEETIFRKGYAAFGYDRELRTAQLFENVSRDTLAQLREQYSFEEVVFIIAARLYQDTALWMRTLRQIRTNNPNFEFEDAIRYIELGVPPQSLADSLEMPFHVVKDLYK